MGLFTETVPRDLYDALQQRYDALLEKYHALRPTHAPVSPMRVIGPRPDAGEATVQAIEAAVTSPRVRAIAEKLMREDGVPEAAALREAKRLDDIARGRAAPVPPRQEG